MFEDIQKSIKAKLYDSINSSLLSSFFISWLFFNRDYFMYYFSNDTLYQKSIYTTFYDFSFGYPLLVALFYVFIYPYFEEIAYKFTLERKQKLKEHKQEIEKQQLLSIDDSRSIRFHNKQLEEENDKLYKQYSELKNNFDTELNTEIEVYKTTIQTLVQSEEKLQIDLHTKNTLISQYIQTIDEDKKQIAELNKNLSLVKDEYNRAMSEIKKSKELYLEYDELKLQANKLQEENDFLKDKLLKNNISLNNSEVAKKYNLTDLEIQVLKQLNTSNFMEGFLSHLYKTIQVKMNMTVIQAENITNILIAKNILERYGKYQSSDSVRVAELYREIVLQL
jgi:hypothetical protein